MSLVLRAALWSSINSRSQSILWFHLGQDRVVMVWVGGQTWSFPEPCGPMLLMSERKPSNNDKARGVCIESCEHINEKSFMNHEWVMSACQPWINNPLRCLIGGCQYRYHFIETDQQHCLVMITHNQSSVLNHAEFKLLTRSWQCIYIHIRINK